MQWLSRYGLTSTLLATAAALPVSAWGQAPTGQTVPLNGFDLYYEVHGTGEPLLLLHGFGGCGGQWQSFVPELAKSYQVIIPDLRGHGRSTNPAGSFTHRQAAADISALLDRLGLQRVRAMGISTGGMTLLHLATRQRERIEAMVLIGATSYFPEEARAIMRRVVEDTTPLAARAQRYRDSQGELRLCASRGDPQLKQLATQFGAFAESYDDMNFTGPLLGTIRARTLIVHGDRDQFFPVSIPVEMYRAIPGAALWIVPQGGHVPISGRNTGAFQETALAFLKAEPRPR